MIVFFEVLGKLEFILLGTFAAVLLVFVFMGQSVLYALAIGYLIFFGYGIRKGHSLKEMLVFSGRGIRTVKNVVLTFLLIGILTASWRASGSIGYIVYYASKLCSPSVMLLLDFLLCALISFLTGTSFGTTATMGVICTVMSTGMGLPIAMTGGAVLAGVFFGDRCSPVSTSALLVSEVTHTDLYTNIGYMVRTSLVPFFISCGIYLVLGMRYKGGSITGSTTEVLKNGYYLSPLLLIPVAAVLVMSVMRCSVKITLAVSSVSAIVLTVLVQGMPLMEVPELCIFGYAPANPKFAALMAGGGLISMVRVFLIVTLSSCYAGMFEGTGFLTRMQKGITTLGNHITPYGALFLTSVMTASIGCNQTLAIMLTDQLCRKTVPDDQERAIDLENTAVIIAALIPWSIAGAVPLSTIGAPTVSIVFAVYLWMLPVWNFFMQVRGEHIISEKHQFT